MATPLHEPKPSNPAPFASAGFIVTVAVATLVPIVAWCALIPLGLRLVRPRKNGGKHVATVATGNPDHRPEPNGAVQHRSEAPCASRQPVTDPDHIEVDVTQVNDSSNRESAPEVPAERPVHDPVAAVVMQQAVVLNDTTNPHPLQTQELDPVAAVIAQQAAEIRAATALPVCAPTDNNRLRFMADKADKEELFGRIDVGAMSKALLVLQLSLSTAIAVRLFLGSTPIRGRFDMSTSDFHQVEFMLSIGGMMALWGSYLSIVGLASHWLKSAKGYKVFLALYFGLTMATPTAIAFSGQWDPLRTSNAVLQIVWLWVFLRFLGYLVEDSSEARLASENPKALTEA